jgi:hypothetical protein
MAAQEAEMYGAMDVIYLYISPLRTPYTNFCGKKY